MSSRNSQSEPFYVSLDVVLEIHQRQLKEFGGADGIRNRSGLEAAVESPKAIFDGEDLYPTIFLKVISRLSRVSFSIRHSIHKFLLHE